MGVLCLMLVSMLIGAALGREIDINLEIPKRNCYNCRYKTDRDRNNCVKCKHSYMDQWTARGDDR